MKILGVETSCDETAVAITEFKNGQGKVLANEVSSQVKLHAKWGGVVPNLAAREHLKNIVLVLDEALNKAKINSTEIDLITATEGPGLIPALLVGVNFAKTLAYLWGKPLIGVHHIAGHIASAFSDENFNFQIDKKFFPLLTLTVSGGHTQLIYMKKPFAYKIIGETQDDAVGEAFDKVARILGLGYPGGPIISQKAKKGKGKNGKYGLNFPRPMINSGDFNFSFSGLKTAVLYAVKKFRQENNFGDDEKLPADFVEAVAFEFQEAVVDVLVRKTIKVLAEHSVQVVSLAGGVAANMELRDKLKKEVLKNNLNFYCPPMILTGDNAVMIAVAGYYQWQKMTIAQKKQARQNWQTLQADSGLKLKNN